MGYTVSTCRDDYNEGSWIYIQLTYHYSEAPYPEMITPDTILGPNFPILDYSDYLRLGGYTDEVSFETTVPKYGSVRDPDEDSDWVDGSPDGDWYGDDYYMASIRQIFLSAPDAYVDWIENDGYLNSPYFDRVESGWQAMWLEPEQVDMMIGGAEIVAHCGDLTENPVDLGSLPKDELDLLIDKEVVADYIDTVVIHQPSLLERGWAFIEETVEGTVDSIVTRFDSPEYQWEDIPDLYEDSDWVNTDSTATEETGGSGLESYYETVTDSGASGLMNLLKDKIRDAGYANLADLFDNAGDAKELHDFNQDLMDETLPMLDNFEIVDGEMRTIDTLEEMEQKNESLRDRVAEYLDENFPSLGAVFKDLTISSRHSNVSYEMTFDSTTLSSGDSHSNRVSFGAQDDLYAGRAGDDILLGGLGSDTLSGGAGDDWTAGGAQADQLSGNAGADVLSGDNGNDTLFGGNGYDTLFGGLGADTLFGGNGRDLAFLGNGNDIFFDNSQGGAHGSDTVRAGGGNDTIEGGNGDDTFFGDGGFDRIQGRLGNDRLFGGDNADTLFGGDGNDTVIGGNGTDRAFLGDGNDVWFDSDEVTFGDDLIFGAGGNDTIHLGGGNDTATGGAGADVFIIAAQINADTIADYGTDADRLEIDAGLWGGALNEAHLDALSSVADGNLMLDFGGGNTILFEGLSSNAGLLDDITLV